MEKPQQILDLEKELGFWLVESGSSDKGCFGDSLCRPAYTLDESGKIIGLYFNRLSFHGWGLVDISFLKEFINLQYIYLNTNKIEDISALENLTQLKSIDLGGNCIKRIDALKELTNLERLELWSNKIKDAFPLRDLINLKYLHLGGNTINKIAFLRKLKRLEFLDLSINYDIKKIKYNVKSIFLDLSELPNLKQLSLPIEKVQDIPLTFLTRRPLEHLNLGYSLIDFPKELQEDRKNIYNEVRTYLQDGETYGLDENKDLKLILIGNGGVGKTSLVRRLVENKFDKEYDSTHGIQLEQYTDLQPYYINIWDFGGQDIYHATHRLFMKTRALFVLVWDWQTEQEPVQKIKENNKINEYQNHDLDYWLNYVKMLGKGSKVIVVQTKVQKHGEKKHPRENELRAKYQDIWLDTISIESEENNWAKNGFKKLKLAIENAIESGDVLRKEELPKNWITQRKEIYDLLESDKKTIDYEYFVTEICKDNPLSPDTILGWLSSSGVVFYGKELFDNKIIIDQQWAIKAVYTLFDREDVYYGFLQNKKGRFTKIDLQKIWKSYKPEEQDLFLSFMLSCEICYYPDYVRDEYIAPAFLPDKKEGGSLADFWEGKNLDWKKYEFVFLHYGIIQSFIVRLNNFRIENISVESVWQYGILFKYNDIFASVEANLQDKTILVNVSQPNDQSLLNKIQNLIYELDNKENITVTFLSMSNVQRQEDENDRFINQLADKFVEKLKPQLSNLEIGQDLLIEETIKNSTTLNRVDETTIRTEQSVGRIEQTLNEMYQEFRGQFQTVITKSDNITNQITDFDQRTTANLAQLDTKFEEIVAYYTDDLLALSQQVITKEIKSLIVTPSKKIKFDDLDNMTKKYLYTAEYAWEAAKKTGASSSLDFSIAIFAFGKAVENEMFALMETFKSATANNPPYTRDFRNLIVKGFRASDIQKVIESSDSADIEGGNTTKGLKHFRTNYATSDVISTIKNDFENCFNTFVTNHFEMNFRTDLVISISNPTLDGLMPSHCITRKYLDFIREVRNSAAHPSNHLRTKQEAEQYRKLVLEFFGFWCNHLK